MRGNRLPSDIGWECTPPSAGPCPLRADLFSEIEPRARSQRFPLEETAVIDAIVLPKRAPGRKCASPRPQALGLDRQVSIPMPEWRPPHDSTGMTNAEVAQWCLDHGVGRLSRKEREFLFDLSRRSDPPTAKQRQRLTDLHERLSQRT